MMRRCTSSKWARMAASAASGSRDAMASAIRWCSWSRCAIRVRAGGWRDARDAHAGIDADLAQHDEKIMGEMVARRRRHGEVEVEIHLVRLVVVTCRCPLGDLRNVDRGGPERGQPCEARLENEAQLDHLERIGDLHEVFIAGAAAG